MYKQNPEPAAANARIIFLDTETTGLAPGQVCQLAYIVQEGNQVYGRNYFFAVESMPAAARAVHGFSALMLRKLSEGREFSHYAREIVYDIQRSERLVAHNAGFDCRFLTAEFSRCGITCNFGRIVCTMQGMRPHCGLQTMGGRSKAPRLEELVDFLQIQEGQIREASSRLFGSADINSHDARYDVAATFLCYRQALKRGLIE